MRTMQQIIDDLTRWYVGVGEPTDADWQDAVVADPTEPRIYEETDHVA